MKPSPTSFVGVTVNEYVTLLVNPVMTHEVVSVRHDPLGEPITRYSVIGDPPLAAADHETVALSSPAETRIVLGAEGMVAGVEVVFVERQLLLPTELTAATYTLIHVEEVLVTLPYIVLGVVALTVEYGLTAV